MSIVARRVAAKAAKRNPRAQRGGGNRRSDKKIATTIDKRIVMGPEVGVVNASKSQKAAHLRRNMKTAEREPDLKAPRVKSDIREKQLERFRAGDIQLKVVGGQLAVDVSKAWLDAAASPRKKFTVLMVSGNGRGHTHFNGGPKDHVGAADGGNTGTAAAPTVTATVMKKGASDVTVDFDQGGTSLVGDIFTAPYQFKTGATNENLNGTPVTKVTVIFTMVA